MDGIHVNVAGEHQVALRLDEFPDGLYEDLRAEIGALGEELLALVRAATPVATGRLLSQERLRVFADKDHIKAYVDIAAGKGAKDFGKAAALEYGAHSPTKVGAHSMKLDHYWSNKLDAPESVLVAAYTRTPDILEHAFERGPLAEMAPEIFERLNAVVEKRVAETNA